MQQNSEIEKRQEELVSFINLQKNLSGEEKRVFAGSIISQVEKINTNQAFANVQQRLNKKRKTIQWINVITRVAAVFMLPLLAFSIWSLFFQSTQTPLASDLSYQELSCPMGMRSDIVLPDGTRMWLNAESSVRYSVPFLQNQRIVELTGEAFLEVKHNKKIPFVVKSGNTSVEVLGTQFNVKAYPEEEAIEVALKKGKIRFNANYENQQKHLELSPGDYIVFNKDNGQVQKENTNVDKYIAWHNNVLVLDETPMEEVAVLLQRWYGVKVIIPDKELRKYKFSTTFENESLFRVLELLELSSPDIQIKYSPGAVNDKTGQSIVLITKKTKQPMRK